MIILGCVGYIIISVCFFVGFVRHIKRNCLFTYVDKEDLVFIIFGSAWWPAVGLGLIIYKLFEFLEWAVNK